MPISTPPKPPHKIANIEELEAYLQELTAFGKPPALSLSIVKKSSIVYNNAFGVADGPNHISATPQTIYHWWSLTKIFTAVAVLQLYEQGKLDIDEPVITHLSFFQVRYPSERSQTITMTKSPIQECNKSVIAGDEVANIGVQKYTSLTPYVS